jgi:hypothetical protein
MSDPNPSATTTSQPPSPDIQQLVGLLGNLMPLLLRFQSQAFPSQIFQPQAFPPQAFPPQAFPQSFEQPLQSGPGNFVVPNPALERQAAENFVADIIAESLRMLSTYLEANAGQHAGLETSVPIVTRAAHRFAARDYAEAFNLIWLAYRSIEMIRTGDPRVPPVRTASPGQNPSSIH